jgi:hypothetical protein
VVPESWKPPIAARTKPATQELQNHSSNQTARQLQCFRHEEFSMRKIGRTLHKRHIRTTMPQEEQRRIRCAG